MDLNPEAILAEWEQDGPLDLSDLARVSADTPKLHSKYMNAMYRAKKSRGKLKSLRRRKVAELTSYYAGEMNSPMDLERLGRDPVHHKAATVSGAQKKAEGDLEVEKLVAAEEVADLTVEILDQILRQISVRQFQVKNALDWKKLEFGG